MNDNELKDLKDQLTKVTAERDYYKKLSIENLDMCMKLWHDISMIRTICEGGEGVGYVSKSGACDTDPRLHSPR